MALYDGFFDAAKDEDTGEYDRTYGPDSFTDYFGNIIGSGVCIHNNADSFKAEYEGGTLYLRPGYLFIRGYWLANVPGEGEAAETYKGYAVTLPSNMTGSMAVVAHLNLGQRLIEIQVVPVAQTYQDALALAVVTSTTAEDTRHNTDICGVIDTAGELSSKVDWAVNYINTQVETKLDQAEEDIQEKSDLLDTKIAAAQVQTERLTPLPVGAVKLSLGNPGTNWLQCDGSTFSATEYPDLNTALGGTTLPTVTLGTVPGYIRAK